MTCLRVLGLVLALAVAPSAEAMRCGTRIVSAGLHQLNVLKICGEPDSIQKRLVYRSGLPRAHLSSSHRLGVRSSGDPAGDELLVHQRSVVEVVIEEWTYNLGPSRLMRLVRFENGIVRDVKTLGYGYRE
jgi:hypothetical protein